MEITKKARFVTRFCGGAPFMGFEGKFKDWIVGTIDKSVLSFGEQIKKKGETAEDAIFKILTIFNRDENGYPIIGDWMMKAAAVYTGKAIFNAMRDKTHPKRSAIDNCINDISPINISLYNGKIITKADGIQTIAMSPKGGTAFFSAWEYVEPGATFEFKLDFDDELVSEMNMIRILEKMRLGKFRMRYGAFELI